MKNIALKILVTVVFIAVITYSIKGQTPVSGGIYSNTTWTLANSPYVVVDTVVVFPGVTLTIQPGVTVKFTNNKRIEIRQAKILAQGTLSDSITFTSNSISPTPGIWDEIFLNGGTLQSKFNYCNFRYANIGIKDYKGNVNDTLIIKNSNFEYNNVGIELEYQGLGVFALIDTCNFLNNINSGIGCFKGMINYCRFLHNNLGIRFYSFDNNMSTIKNCIVDSNQTGIYSQIPFIADNCTINYNQRGINVDQYSGNSIIKNCIIDSNSVYGLALHYRDTVTNCQIKYNAIGIIDSLSSYNVITRNVIENNTIGIKFRTFNVQVYCNKICNNSSYDIYMTNNTNINISNNYWCTSDSVTIASHIYDGYDNINLGLVSFVPFDTLQCYLITGIPINTFQNLLFNIFPNPASDNLTVTLKTCISKAEIKIFNMFGELEYSSIATRQNTNIDLSTLTSGVHIIQIAVGDNISRQKFIKQ